MQKRWPELKRLILIFIIWRLFLLVVEWASPKLWSLRPGFLGPVPWANMDGVHYLSIAQSGYYQFEQAFFPLYPLLIRWGATTLGWPPHMVALAISHAALLIGLWFFMRLGKSFDSKNAWWAVIFLLVFPTSFFFAAVYTESLFLALAAATFWFAHRKQWWLVGLWGGLASLTRLFGVFLLVPVAWQYLRSVKQRRPIDLAAISVIPLGLISYMWYLWSVYGDPLLFFHAQPAFGAGRSADSIILLPQVLWRYLKIFFTVDPQTIIYMVATIELVILVVAALLLVHGWRQKKLRPYLAFSALVLLVPTLTGTLSSMPRYFLSAFPLFLVMSAVHNRWIKWGVVVLSVGFLIIFESLFLRGYFVS